MANKPNWSPVQLRAIQSRNENLLVSASAGSGKTTVMIGRIIDLIDKADASLDKMLICTFTRASAQDMKEKLYDKLIEKKNESKNPQKFERQISLIPIADISTIDSWCVKLVRNYFYAIDADPAFEILDDKESDAMLMQAIDGALEKFLSRPDNEDFLVLYESMYKNRSDKEFRKLILKVYGFVMTQANPQEWLENSCNYYDGSYASIREEMLRNEERACLTKCDEIMSQLSGGETEKAFCAVADLASALRNGTELPSLSYKNVNLVLQAKMKKLREKAVTYVKKRDASAKSEPIDSAYTKQIADFTLEVIRLFEQEKEKKAVMDFSDCEHKAYEILTHGDILADVREKYDYVFVDEYQDTNPLQEAIVSKLKKNGNMFFVGDIKQSIYAFRNCDPAIFGNLYDNYERYGFAKPIDFVTNYRCGQKIIDFVNRVFNPLMTRDFGGVSYVDYQLQGFSETTEGEVKATVFKPLKKAESVECDYDIECEEDESNTVKFAETILFDITQNLNKKKKNGEKVTFSDIAILTPKRNELTYVLYEKMRQRGIPVHMSKDMYFSSNPTVRYILDVLTYLDDNENDIAFVSSVTSPYFGITPKDVVTLCKSKRKTQSLVSSARRYVKQNNDELSQKLAHVFDFFDKYSEFSMFVPVKDTVSAIIVEMDYFDRIIRTKGTKEADVLSLFLDSLNACPYADTLDSYLKFIESGGDKCEIKPEDHCVNIMTIHSSKGLEFPYVYLINTETAKNNSHDLCLPDKQLGLAMKSIDKDNKVYEENPLYELVKEISDKKIKEEYARLLYVALTRPKDGLYIYASVKETQKANFYDGNPILSDTLFGWMSEAIISLGYTTVESEDVEILDTVKPNRAVNPAFADGEFVATLTKRFEKMDEIYASKSDVGLKSSVTGIASEEAEGELPQVDEERVRKSKDDPIKKGNAYHKTMELIDFTLPFEQAYALVENGNVPDFELVVKDKILSAYNNVKPLLENAKAYKEKSFIYNDGTRLIQGIIDLLIIKDNVATVVDYKTTSLYSLAQEKTMAEYKIQVGIYAEAVREIMGLNVDKVMLYSFEKDGFIQL